MAVRACTAANQRNRFCDRPSLPEAPFPICVQHAAQIYKFLRGVIDDPASRNALDRQAASLIASNVRRPSKDVLGIGVVYYVQVGALLKIGTTQNRVGDRMTAYPPHKHLLAAEPGGYVLESKRLTQFRHLRATGREWFDLGPDLRAHIAEIRDRHGVPEERADWRPIGSSDTADPKVLMRTTNADFELAPTSMPKVGSPEMDAIMDALDNA